MEIIRNITKTTKVGLLLCFIALLLSCTKEVENDKIEWTGADLTFNSESSKTSTITSRLSVPISGIETHLNMMESQTKVNESFRVADGKIAPCIRGACAGSWKIDADAKGSITRTGDIALSVNPNKPNVISIKMPLYFDITVKTRGTLKISETVTGRVEIYSEISPVINKDWTVNPNITVKYKWIDTPSFIVGNNITGKHRVTVKKFLSGEMNKLVSKTEKKLNKDLSSELSIKENANQLWDDLFIVRKLKDDNLWVYFKPQEFILANPRIENGILIIEAGIKGKAAVYIDNEAPKLLVAKLPNPTIIDRITPSLHLVLPLAIDYGVLNKRLTSLIKSAPPLVYKISEQEINSIEIKEISIYPSNNRLVFKMTFSSDSSVDFFNTTATVHLLASPQLKFDQHTKSISFRDFEVGLDSDNDFIDIFSATFDSVLEFYVNEYFELDFSDKYQEILDYLNSAITKYDNNGLTLQGEIVEAHPDSIALFNEQMLFLFTVRGGVEAFYSKGIASAPSF